MRIRKQRRKNNGKVIVSKCYTGFHRFSWDKGERSIALKTTDSTVAKKRLKEWIRVEELKHESLPLPAGLWTGPKLNIVSLLKEYTDELTTVGRKPLYTKNTKGHIERLSKEVGWTTITDVRPNDFIAWRSAKPACLTKNTELSASSLNDYLASISQFMGWLVRRELIERNPFLHVQKVETRGREAFKRRAMSDSELRLFLEAGYSYGHVVLFLARTGLRKEEAQQLLWSDVHLEDAVPYIHIRPEISKNKEETNLPLCKDIVILLKVLNQNKSIAGRIFKNRFPRGGRFKSDMKKIGIEPVNETGLLDFHSLRHTYVTFIMRNNI